MNKDLENVGLTPEQEEQAWIYYDSIGNVTEVAKALGVPWWAVSAALKKDPIRMYEMNLARAEAVRARWGRTRDRAGSVLDAGLEMLQRMMAHVIACEDAGTQMTDLEDDRGEKMSVNRAKQWLISKTRVIEAAATSAGKASSVLLDIAKIDTLSQPINNSTDPSKLGNGDLAKMVQELTAMGRELPEGVLAWAAAQEPQVQAQLHIPQPVRPLPPDTGSMPLPPGFDAPRAPQQD